MVIDKNVFADRSATRGTVEYLKSIKAKLITPFFLHKCGGTEGVQRLVKKLVLLILVNRAIKPLGKIFRTQKKKKNSFFSKIQSVEAGFQQPNFPSVILSLLTGL